MYRAGRGNVVPGHRQTSGSYSSVVYNLHVDLEPAWDEPRQTDVFPSDLELFPRPATSCRLAGRCVGTGGAATLAGSADPEPRPTSCARPMTPPPSSRSPRRRDRIGEFAAGAWCLVPEGEGWAVFWAQGEDRLELATLPTAVASAALHRAPVPGPRRLPRRLPPATEALWPREWPIQRARRRRPVGMYGGKRLVSAAAGHRARPLRRTRRQLAVRGGAPSGMHRSEADGVPRSWAFHRLPTPASRCFGARRHRQRLVRPARRRHRATSPNARWRAPAGRTAPSRDPAGATRPPGRPP